MKIDAFVRDAARMALEFAPQCKTVSFRLVMNRHQEVLAGHVTCGETTVSGSDAQLAKYGGATICFKIPNFLE